MRSGALLEIGRASVRPVIAALTLVACSSDPAATTSLGGGSEAGATTSTSTGMIETSAGTTNATATTVSPDTSAGSSSTEDAPIFDVAPSDFPSTCTDQGCGADVEFSYIWIASPDQGNPNSTVAKINTETLAIEGRYYTRPDLIGNASRTSVNLSGRAVAVANRWGGVTKIWARSEDCVDTNANGLQTSSGDGDVLAWGEDDCIAWHTPFPEYQTQRPVAWSAGEYDRRTCEYVDERVWTAGCPGPYDGGGDGGPVFVHRLDGEDGTVVDTLEIPELPCTGTGPYGGAVDGDGNFWVFVRGEFVLARVDPDNDGYTIFDIPSTVWCYGLAVDHAGRPWCSAWPAQQDSVGGGRFDPATNTWDLLDGYDFSSLGGLQEGTDGRMWISTLPFGAPSPNGVFWVDTDTLTIGDQITVPDINDAKGISIDAQGYVWVVTLYGAHKLDPVTYAVQGSIALPFSYTYSDMTGWGLANATCTPRG